MEHTRFVGLDIHKERISISVAESGRSGALEYLGEITNDPGAISKLCDRLRRPGKPLAFCYEAGPCVADLQDAIERFVAETNENPKPFIWTKNPDKIIAAVKRGHQMLESIH